MGHPHPPPQPEEPRGVRWAKRAHAYLARHGYFRGFRRLSDGQRYQLIREGLEEYLRLNPLPPEHVDEALEWMLESRRLHEARALAKLTGRRLPTRR